MSGVAGQLHPQLGRLASSLSTVGIAAASIAADTALKKWAIDIATETTKMAAAFETETVKLQTLIGLTAEEVESLKQSVLGLSGDVGLAPRKLAEGLFFIESAGLRGKVALEALEQTAKASAVGLGSLGTVADAVSSAVNAYGVDMLSATKATDLMLLTVREGKLAPQELASSLGSVLPIASQMSVSLEEVGAGIASLTRVGFSASEASTALRASMVAFLKPGDAAAKILKEYGLTAEKVRRQIREEGLLSTLISLRETFRGNEEGLAKVIGRVEGLNAVLALTGDRAGETLQILDNMKNSTDTVNDAFEIVSQTAEHKFARAMAELNALGIQLGAEFLPAVTDALGVVADLADALEGLGGKVAVVSGKIGILHTILGVTFGPLVTGLENLSKAGIEIEDTFAFLTGLPTAQISEMAELFSLLGDQMETIPPAANETKGAVDGLLPTFKTGKDIIDAFSLSGGVLDKVLQDIEVSADRTKLSADNLTGAWDKFFQKFDPAKKDIHAVGLEFEFLNQQGFAPAIPLIGGMALAMQELNLKGFVPVTAGIGDVAGAMEAAEARTVSWSEVVGNFSGIMGDAGNILSIFGVEVDSTIGKITRLISSFESLFNNITGIIGLFTGGGGGGGGGLGSLLGGLFSGGGGGIPGVDASGLLSAGAPGTLSAVTGAGASAGGSGLGAAFSSLGSKMVPFFTNPFTIGVGAALAVFFATAPWKKASAGSTAKFLGIDFDALSKDLQKNMQQMGEHVGSFAAGIQLNIGGAFAEGAFNIDQFAEKIGDTFSFLEREEITATQAQQLLNETVAQLLPHLEELGPAGEAQIQRIIGAAKEMGIEFEGLGDLIAASMGPTLQDVSNQLGVSIDVAKQLADDLGIKLPTATQKLAAELGVTPKFLREIGAAIKSEYGIPLEGIQGLLAIMGITIEDLATAFGIDVKGGIDQANSAAEGLGQTISDIPRTVDVTIRETLERVSRGGGDGGIPGLEHGGWAPKAPTPFGSLYRLGEREPELVIPKSKVGQVAAAIAPQPIIIHITNTLDGKAINKNIIKTVNDGKATGRIQ